MSARLIVAILSSLIEEAALVAIVLVGFPHLGVNIPIPGLVALMVGWGIISVTIYRAGSRALRKKPVTGREAMVGRRGKVVSSLEPEGVVKIGAELWRAKSAGARIEAGEEVIVLGSDGKKLVVGAGGDVR